jgi:class 3 adenylate cyclase
MCQERTHALQQIRGIKTRCQSSRLSGKVLAEPGGICISSSAYDQARGTVPVAFPDLGEQRLKNIDLAPTR